MLCMHIQHLCACSVPVLECQCCSTLISLGLMDMANPNTKQPQCRLSQRCSCKQTQVAAPFPPSCPCRPQNLP